MHFFLPSGILRYPQVFFFVSNIFIQNIDEGPPQLLHAKFDVNTSSYTHAVLNYMQNSGILINSKYFSSLF